MLDKSIPYHNIIMRCDAETARAISAPPLPKGYRFRAYAPGDAAAWAAIEASVGEFASVGEAKAYFAREYLPHEKALEARCFFVEAPDGALCATANAWWNDSPDGHWASLHWVAVMPGHQGKGIGNVIIRRAMEAYPFVEPSLPVYLHTQTWSYQAVSLYLKAGFYPLKTERFAHYANDYAAACPVLSGPMKKAPYEHFLRTAR